MEGLFTPLLTLCQCINLYNVGNSGEEQVLHCDRAGHGCSVISSPGGRVGIA